MKKTILALCSLLLYIGFSPSLLWGQMDESYFQNKMAPYYSLEPSSYFRINGDSIISDRKVKVKDYVRDTLCAYFDYLWKPLGKKNKGVAAYFTYAVRAGDFWQCNDYYSRIHKKLRWGFFEDQQLTIPVGPFRQYYENGQIQQKGYYKNGTKSGHWEWFNQEGQLTGDVSYINGVATGNCFRVTDGDTVIRRLDSLGAGYSYKKLTDGRTLFQGKYLSGGIEDSIWNYYDDEGRLWYTEQFMSGKQLAVVCYDTMGVVMTKDTAFQQAEFKDLSGYLEKNVHFPPALYPDFSSGKAVVKFRVNKLGDVDKIKILKSLELRYDYLLVLVFEQIPKWKPAKRYGRIVESYYVLPFSYERR